MPIMAIFISESAPVLETKKNPICSKLCNTILEMPVLSKKKLFNI